MRHGSSRIPVARQMAALTLVLSGDSLLTGCSSRQNGATDNPPPPQAQTKQETPSAPPAAPAVNLAVDKPNELGRVPILEYHHIEAKEERWTRTPANFRKDLEKLYKLGYRPVSLMDYVHGKIDVPPGKSPVILTFDDSDPGQFRYIGSGPSAKLDPNCAVAIMLDFTKKHPDFPAKATFYVLPSLFGQPAFEERKLKELKEWGFEIGNHTFSHPQLRRVSRAEAEKEIAKGVGVTRKYLPGYEVLSIALPNGSIPKDDTVLRSGKFGETAYRHEAALLVGAEPAPSPFNQKFNPFRLPRIQATDTVKPGITDWLGNLEKGGKFRSDGNPEKITYPKDVVSQLSAGAVKKRRVHIY